MGSHVLCPAYRHGIIEVRLSGALNSVIKWILLSIITSMHNCAVSTVSTICIFVTLLQYTVRSKLFDTMDFNESLKR